MAVLAAPPALAENGSLRFDGVDDHVTVTDPVDLRGPLTLEAWVKVDVDPSGGRIISNRASGAGYELDVARYGDYYELRYSSNGYARDYATFTGHEGTWTHVAVTWAGIVEGTTHLYINGTEVSSDTTHQAIKVTSGPLRFGSMGNGSWFYRGQIDEVRIWSTVLDGATLAEWMSRRVTLYHPDYANLEGYWNFDELTGQTTQNLVGDAGRDGALGLSTAEDGRDPLWQREGAPVPVERTTIGQIKQRFLKQ
jgi:hypothetical protein